MSKSMSAKEKAEFQARRAMLKFGTCGSMTGTTFLSTLLHLKMTNAVMAAQQIPTSGYKALVCVFLSGGIDSFNVLTPYGTTQNDPQYQGYVSARGGAALKRTLAWDGDRNGAGTDGYLLPIVDSATGRTFGLHPSFNDLRTIYNNGHATFCVNTGQLHEPLNSNAGFKNGATIKPIGLYSHSDQQRHWQSAVPASRNQVQGWGGRMMDLMTDDAATAEASNVYSVIATSGRPLFLTGNRIVPYVATEEGATLVDTYGADTQSMPNNPYDRIFRATYSDLATQTHANLLERTIAAERLSNINSATAFQQAFSSTTLGSPFSGELGASLEAVAKAIKIASGTSAVAPLKQKRQIFMVNYGGWDNHGNVLGATKGQIGHVDGGLKQFYDWLVNNNLLNRVTVFTISDFGRTLSFNGSGTDHAWGGNCIVMGGAVNGGRIYGTYPDFVSADMANSINTGNNGLDRGRGVLIPTTSCDEYHRELCRWFGVTPGYMSTVLPNIGNFSSTPLGFMS